MQLGYGGAVIPLPAAGPGKSSAGGSGKFYLLKRPLTGLLFIHFSHKI